MAEVLYGLQVKMGIAMVIVAGGLISLTLLSVDPVGSALCGIPEAPSAWPLSFSLMPAYLLILLAGSGSCATPYMRGLLKRGFGKEDFKRLFLGLVVAGGSVYSKDAKYCIRYYGKDLAMHEVFADLAFQVYLTRPRTVMVKSRGTYMSQLYSKPAVVEVGEFSPDLATRKGKAPTISYVLEGDGRLKLEAARVLMSSSGWVTCTYNASNGAVRTYPRLGLGSVLDNRLADEYAALLETVPLSMDIHGNGKYLQTSYLATTRKGEMANFLRVGGFLDGSTVKKGSFSGMDKNRLLRAVVRSQGTAYASREEAVESLSRAYDGSALELGLYLDRLRLG